MRTNGKRQSKVVSGELPIQHQRTAMTNVADEAKALVIRHVSRMDRVQVRSHVEDVV